MLYYFSSSLFNWWHAWEENPRLLIITSKIKTSEGDIPLFDASIPRGRVKLVLQRETFQDEAPWHRIQF